jgi:predicted metalloprotease with PDZ domain
MIKAFAAGLLAACVWLPAQASPGPTPAPPNPPIPAARDIPFPGAMTLAVDATDVTHRIVRVRETIPVTGPQMVLYYPRWMPGVHTPYSPIDRVSGVAVTAGGQPLRWVRDSVDVWAFHVAPPPGAGSIEVTFEYLSPARDAVGPVEMSSNMAIVEWISLVLYPAGYYVRQIPVDASLTLPAGWSFATALDRAETQGTVTSFRRAPLETLVDSPVYAGVNFKTLDLTPPGGAPVRLNLVADRPDNLEIKPAVLAQHKALIQQALKLFGARHYDHYDFLLSLSDIVVQLGLEHHRSSENGEDSDHFTAWDKAIATRDLLGHEFTHSWNGKFRRPADLWTETYNTPMRDDLLWMYEGQTQYWGEVLTARAGLHSREEALETWAIMAAFHQATPRRAWESLQDTTNNELVTYGRRPQSWYSRAGGLDYYREGALIWMEADTLIRERSGGKRSLDDFAGAFFGADDGGYIPVTYGFDDVVAALNAVEPYDWAGFLHARLDEVGRPAPLEGLTRGGYRLAFDETPGPVWRSREALRKTTDLSYSIGLSVGADGQVGDVFWDGPAFKTGLTQGVKIVAVNGTAFDTELLKGAVTAAKAGAPIELIVQDQTQFRIVRIDWRGGLRYPHLIRDGRQPAGLDDILAARK